MAEKMLWASVKKDKVDNFLMNFGSERDIDLLVRNVRVLSRVDWVNNAHGSPHALHLLYCLKGESSTMHITWLDLHEFTEPPTQSEIETMKMLGYTWRFDSDLKDGYDAPDKDN